MFRRLPVALAAVAVLALPAAAPAKTTIPKGPSGTAFYKPPSPVPGKKHGDLIRARRETRGTLPSAAQHEPRPVPLDERRRQAGRRLGRRRDPQGQGAQERVARRLLGPRHTGIADSCAPSRAGAGGNAKT